jgi:hypothetical protein
MVYFALKDKSPESIQRHVDACHKYLDGHEGVVFFAVGTRTPDLLRPVNDKEFDVGLHVVFADRASHDEYQTHPRHVEFIEETKPTWASARVFDADLGQTPPSLSPLL